jgi:hypothetical protein
MPGHAGAWVEDLIAHGESFPANTPLVQFGEEGAKPVGMFKKDTEDRLFVRRCLGHGRHFHADVVGAVRAETCQAEIKKPPLGGERRLRWPGL